MRNLCWLMLGIMLITGCIPVSTGAQKDATTSLTTSTPQPSPHAIPVPKPPRIIFLITSTTTDQGCIYNFGIKVNGVSHNNDIPKAEFCSTSGMSKAFAANKNEIVNTIGDRDYQIVKEKFEEWIRNKDGSRVDYLKFEEKLQ